MSDLPLNHLDVAHLPDCAMDEASPLWWGNLLMIFIETTTVALMLAIYFYVKMNFDEWPPPKVDVFPVLYHPVPDLGWATFNTIMVVVSCALMYWTDMAARRKDQPKVRLGLTILFVIASLATYLIFKEFPATKFWWNDNAYASAVWCLLGLQVLYLLAAALEFAVMDAWIFTHKLDEKHALDVTLAGGYWYWTAGVSLILYLVIFWSPRWM